MIRRVKYSEIDFEKYSECLEKSLQNNWYAQKEVLDQLSGNWELLVQDDYVAVMPVHIKKKMLLNFAHMPLFCQQLGVFSKVDDSAANSLFLKSLKKYYIVFFYSFNQYNNFTETLEKRKNYIIPVSDYLTLKRKKYFKGRKSTVKWSQHLNYSEIVFDFQCRDFINKNFKGLHKKSDYDMFLKYLEFLDKRKTVKFCGVLSEGKLINLAILVDGKSEVSLLALVNDENFKSQNGPSFLIDAILNNYIDIKSLNFMGSNIRGIEVFFKSFGADLKDYCYIENKLLKRFI